MNSPIEATKYKDCAKIIKILLNNYCESNNSIHLSEGIVRYQYTNIKHIPITK